MTVYGIPTCGTVKKARKWMEDQGISHRWVDMRRDPPGRDRVARWVHTFGVAAMRNTSGGSYRALGPERDTWDDTTWIDAFTRDPMLIRRPVVERDGVPVMVGFSGSDADRKQRLGLG